MSSIFVFIISIFLCWSNPIKVIESTVQEWNSGMGKTHGTNFTIKFIAKKTSDYIVPSEVYLNNEKIKFIVLYKNKKLDLNSFQFDKNDTLIVKCSYSENKFEKNNITENKKNSINIVFKCVKSHKNKTINISKFTKLNNLIYP